MAKDAKVGSLIGLVLIFIMAFVINGFTRSGGAQNNTVPSTTTTDNIGDFDTNGYSSTDLPTTGGAGIDDSTSNTEVTDSLVSHPTTEPNVPEQVTDEGSEVPESELEKSSLSEVYYAVCKGDNLAEIAKKFYGPEEGNKRANIKRLFEANRNVLTSPHKLSIGQKLLIPSLEVLKAKNNKAESVFADSMFETVKSIGGKPSSATKSDTNQLH